MTNIRGRLARLEQRMDAEKPAIFYTVLVDGNASVSAAPARSVGQLPSRAV